jgi:hypothetical protein
VCVCNIKNNKYTRARVCVYRWRRPAPFGRAKSQLVRRLWMRAAYVNKIRTRPQGSPRAFDVLPPDSCALHGPHAHCKYIYIYILYVYVLGVCDAYKYMYALYITRAHTSTTLERTPATATARAIRTRIILFLQNYTENTKYAWWKTPPRDSLRRRRRRRMMRRLTEVGNPVFYRYIIPGIEVTIRCGSTVA